MTLTKPGPDYVLALDPGKATGWGFINLLTGELTAGEADFDEICERLLKIEDALGEHLQIVAEAFLITPTTHKNTQSPWSLEVIGVARWYAHRTGNGLHLTKPSEAKNFSSDARLRALGWYQPGKGHANDALRHLLLHLCTRRGWWDTKLDATV